MARRVAIVVLGICCWLAASVAVAGETLFEVNIQPLLKKKCGKCHHQQVRKGDLDLSTLAAIRRGGESGDALIAESLDDSLLWKYVSSGDMPPAGQPQLNDPEIDLIRKWIVGGAKSQQPMASATKGINQHDVLPILLLRCATCHGARLQQGGLDLRTVAAMFKGGKHGSALVRGDPDASLMIRRIESEACPPQELLLKFFVRRPPKSEVKTLREWIAADAPITDVVPDIAPGQPDPLVTEQDRQHWAFQSPQPSPAATSIDDFIGCKLDATGLTFAPEADRHTLIRRVYFDLIGLPPSLDELNRWRQSDDPMWYESMIDHLLLSPRYGERWGRYWLDLAGYADSEGGISADPIRPVAWKYRDYVIDAFNSDKPYDRFLIEQIAGDELIDYEQTPVVTDEMVNNLIATGFLRMGIDETGSRTMNFVPERLKVISDAITVVSSGLMGLTMECARCHSHKYDPIPHRDYYRFKAIFQGALDEHDWSSFKTRTLKTSTLEQRRKLAAVNPPLEAELKQLLSRQKKLAGEIQLALLRHHYPDQSEANNQQTLVALKKADNNRTLPQKILVERLLQAEVRPESDQPKSVLDRRQTLARMQIQIDRIRRRMVPPLKIRALWDFGRPSPTYILRRGEHDKPGELVSPGVPSVLTGDQTPFQIVAPFPQGTPKTGRRLALAKWLTRPAHPLTSRVMVNRIWHHHFGAGLVRELDNFGVKGGRPSHPALLDWLATEFAQRRWSMKEMHRLMMISRTYRQSSRVSEQSRRLDSNNRLLSHMPLRRLDAEALRDSLLLVAGKLDPTPGGLPDPVSVDRDGMVSANPTSDGRWRRSVYLQYRRTEIPTMMDTFDYPPMGPNCVQRNVSTVSPQSLMLMNNQRVRELAAAFADRVQASSSGAARAAQVDVAYKLALSRPPSHVERELGAETLLKLELAWQQQPAKALETYCHTILNSAAFLYVD